MKTNKYQRRFYRDWIKAKDLHFSHVIEKDTDLEIFTNRPLDKDFVSEKIRSYRWDIEHYIDRDRGFLTALKPIPVELTAPAIVREMGEAAFKVNVGPMSAVGGAIAQFLGKDLLKRGYKDVLIENGGDIFMSSRKSRIVKAYTGKSKLWHKLSLKIKPKIMPLGICTASAIMGHTLSLGVADSVVILSKNASLADAVATATSNLVNSKQDLSRALGFARSVRGVLGVVIILKDELASWGKGFEFV